MFLHKKNKGRAKRTDTGYSYASDIRKIEDPVKRKSEAKRIGDILAKKHFTGQADKNNNRNKFREFNWKRWNKATGIEEKTKMFSFKQFLLEAMEGLPGKDTGYVDHKKIDGHDVHVRYYHMGRGKYRPTVTVNGKYHKETEHSPETNAKIMLHVKSSMKNFLRDKHPTKVKLRGNSEKKQKIYKTFAQSDIAKKAGFKPKETRKNVILANPSNKTTHVPSGTVQRDANNPAHERPSEKKSFKGNKFDMKGWQKKKKNKSNVKSNKFEVKKSVKKSAGDAATGSW
jgi:hypothetical protein